MNIIYYFKFGNVEFGQFTVLIFLGLVVLFIGIANKASYSDSKLINDNPEPSSSPISTKTELSLKIINTNGLVIITLGDCYNIVDFSFFWDVIGERKDVTPEREKIFLPEQAVLDFKLNTGFDSYGFEFCQLIEQYREFKGKKLAICGLAERLKEVYFELDDKDYLEGAILFNTLDDALSYYKLEHLK